MAASVLIAIGAAAAAAMLVGGPRARERSIAPRFDRADALALPLGYLAVAWVFAQPGIPALRHDWDFQADPAAFARSLADSATAWSYENLGTPSFRAGIDPWLLGVAALGRAGSPAFALASSFAASFAAAFWATRRVALRLARCNPAVAVAVAVFYSAAPPFIERVIAGHYMHVYAQALYPVAVLLALRIVERPTRRSIPEISVAALAIGASAQQPFAFAIVTTIFMAIVVPLRPLSAIATLVGITLAVLDHAFAAAATPAAAFSLAHAVVGYEVSQSAPPALLLHLSGSVGRYWEAATNPGSNVALATLVALSAFGCGRLTPVGRALYLAGCGCGLVMLGTYGPLGTLEARAFSSFAPLSIVRELYDLAPFVTFAVALGVASAAARTTTLLAGLALTAAIGVAITPTFAQTGASLVPHLDDALAERSAAGLPGLGRILWLPGIYPMRNLRGQGEGYDPLARANGPHDGISAYQPDGATQRAYWLLDRDPAAAQRWLRTLGCAYIGLDERVQIVGSTGPSLARMRANARRLAGGTSVVLAPGVLVLPLRHPDERLVVAPAVALTPNSSATWRTDEVRLLGDDPLNAHALALLGYGAGAWTLFKPSTVAVDPALGFVAAANHWRDFPEASSLPGDPVVATGPSVTLEAGALAARWQGAAGPLGRASSSVRRIGGTTTIHFPGRVALVGVRHGPPIAGRELNVAGSIRVERGGVSTYVVRALAPTRALALRERYAPGWQVEGDASAIHFRADGWANGWLVDMQTGSTVRIVYRPQETILLVERISAVAYVALAALCGIGLCLQHRATFRRPLTSGRKRPERSGGGGIPSRHPR